MTDDAEKRLVIRVNTNLNWSRGKMAAHAVHAALKLYGIEYDHPIIVLGSKPPEILEQESACPGPRPHRVRSRNSDRWSLLGVPHRFGRQARNRGRQLRLRLASVMRRKHQRGAEMSATPTAAAAAAITAWLEDELERQNWNVPDRYAEWFDHAELAAAVLAVLQPEVITTQERLDELPFLSVIREVFRNSPSGADYGGLYERRTSGWHCVAGAYKDSPGNGAPKLPCRVLWNPTEEQK